MNTVTDLSDPVYGLAVVACDSREGVVLSAHTACSPSDAPCKQTEFDEKKAEIDEIRADCDKIFASFEALRTAQLTARDLTDKAEAGEIGWKEAVSAAQIVAQAWSELRAVVQGTPWISGAASQ